MNADEWAASFEDAVRLPREDPERAAEILLGLAAAAERAAGETLGDWHQQQALGTAGSFLEEAGELERAQQLYQRTLSLCRNSATYWSRATSSILASIALLQFRQGRSADAMSTGEEALRYLGREPDATSIMADMMKEMAKHRRKPGDAEPGQSTGQPRSGS